MYTPPEFAMDGAATRRLLGDPGAVDLVTATDHGLVASVVPMIFAPEVGEHGALQGHLARANDHWQHRVHGPALAIVRGTDGYVTPSWYAAKAEHGRVVPTWNYLVAHVRGRLVVHDDAAWVEGLVRRLTAYHEADRDAPWSVDDAPPGYLRRQLAAIVGVEVVIERVEAKAKLSQNRSDEDRAGVVDGLRRRGDAALAEAVDAARRTPGR